MTLKYFIETPEGNRVGPYSLSEAFEKFGDCVLIPADDAAQLQDTDSPGRDRQALPSHPTQLELQKIFRASSSMALGAIALILSLLGALSIAVGFFATFDKPSEYQLTHFALGTLGLLINAIATLIALCALLFRLTILPTIALAVAILSSAAFINIPPQTQPKPSTRMHA